jgi:AraC-like DNA-binding protein
MSSKEIHLTFQVFNFLSSSEERASYKLVPFERELLLFLSKHIGHKGICPSVQTLAKEMNCSDRTLRRYFASLTEKKLLTVEYKLGKPSQYNILLPRTISVRTEEDIKVCDPGQQVSGHPGQIQHDPGHTVSANKKDRTRKKKKESTRARSSALPLSIGFEPSEACRDKQRALGLTDEEGNVEYRKFIDHYVTNGAKKRDWNIVFMGWLQRTALYLERKPAPVRPALQVVPTAPKPEKEYTVEDRERALVAMRTAMATLREKGLLLPRTAAK